jgi:nanoRNase/pAp phosphatase (c-di-AMP/oligoRNAs hydrolase)
MGSGANMNMAGVGSGLLSLSSLAEGYTTARAARAQASFEATQSDINARFSMMQADDAMKRGDEEAAKYARQAAQVKGSQRVALAAQGIALDDGTALELQEQTAEAAAQDLLTIKNNAWREAWGFRTQASNFQGQARMTRLTGDAKANAALLSGGMRALGHGMDAAYKSGAFNRSSSSSFGNRGGTMSGGSMSRSYITE